MNLICELITSLVGFDVDALCRLKLHRVRFLFHQKEEKNWSVLMSV